MKLMSESKKKDSFWFSLEFTLIWNDYDVYDIG